MWRGTEEWKEEADSFEGSRCTHFTSVGECGASGGRAFTSKSHLMINGKRNLCYLAGAIAVVRQATALIEGF